MRLGLPTEVLEFERLAEQAVPTVVQVREIDLGLRIGETGRALAGLVAGFTM